MVRGEGESRGENMVRSWEVSECKVKLCEAMGEEGMAFEGR